MRLIKEKDLPDFETGHTEHLRSAVQMGDENFYFFIVLLYTFSKHSEEPECCNFLHDILSYTKFKGSILSWFVLRYTNISHEISA